MRQTTVLMLTLGMVTGTIEISRVATIEAQAKLTLSNQTRTVDCANGTVTIAGRQNTITVTGECRKVDVSGTENNVAIDAVAAIEVTGTGNKVTWSRAVGRDEPRVSLTGSNTITRTSRPPSSASPSTSSGASGADAAPPRPSAPRSEAPAAPASEPAPAPARKTGTRPGITQPSLTATTVKVLEDDREDTVDCNGREVSILGNRNSLRLRGSCPLVIVAGSDNVLDVDTADRVRTTGDRNRITWTKVTSGAEPQVQNTGTDNRVTKADRTSSPR